MFCNKETDSGEIKVLKYMNHYMTMSTISDTLRSWEYKQLPDHQQLIIRSLVEDPDSDVTRFYMSQGFS